MPGLQGLPFIPRRLVVSEHCLSPARFAVPDVRRSLPRRRADCWDYTNASQSRSSTLAQQVRSPRR